jgi:hypothetical protein
MAAQEVASRQIPASRENGGRLSRFAGEPLANSDVYA